MALSFGRQYVWTGANGTDFSDYKNWDPIYFPDKQPPGDGDPTANPVVLGDLVIFNSGSAVTVDGHNSLVAEIDIVLNTTVNLQNAMEGTGEVSGVSLMVDSGGVLNVGAGAEMIGIGAVDVIGFSGLGTVNVLAGGAMDDNGMVLGDRANSSGTVTVEGTLVVANNLPGQPNGILIVGNGGAGTMIVRNGGSLGSSFAELADQVGSSGTATVEGGKWSGGRLTIGKVGDGSLTVRGAGGVLEYVDVVVGAGGAGIATSLDGGLLGTQTMEIGASGTLEASSGLVGSPGSVTAQVFLTMSGGMIDVSNGGLVVAGAMTMAGGTIDVSTGGMVIDSTVAATGTPDALQINSAANFIGLGKINGNVRLTNHGTVSATGAAPGLLRINGDISADLSGGDILRPLMTLDLNGAVAANVAIVFTDWTPLEPGVLVLEKAADEAGTISGFAEQNTIDIPGLKFTTALFTQGTLANPGTLTLSGGGETPLFLPVAGNYGPNDFSATSDALGTAVVLVSCFAAGTRIATSEGPVPVEHLASGMCVATQFGGLTPVRWVGHRHIDCRRHPEPDKVWPVRVHSEAFGPGLPERDLWLSPDHAVFANGVLIPVKLLINRTSIAQVPRDEVTYYHVEVARHDLLLAEGLTVESYLDTGDRCRFANGGASVALHPDFSARVWEMAGCVELVQAGPILGAVRQLVARRVGEMDRVRDAIAPAVRQSWVVPRGR